MLLTMRLAYTPRGWSVELLVIYLDKSQVFEAWILTISRHRKCKLHDSHCFCAHHLGPE